MKDFAVSTRVTEQGSFAIRQPLALDDPQDYVEIEMSVEQADRLIKELQSWCNSQ